MGRMPDKWSSAYTAYGKKIDTFARNSFYTIPGYTQEDMKQELLEVLWWCVFDYHPRNGATFNTFFQTSARNRISSLIRLHNTQKRKAEVVSLDSEELASAVEEMLTVESPEDTVIRRMMVKSYVVEIGQHGLRQLIKDEGTGVLLRDGEDADIA